MDAGFLARLEDTLACSLAPSEIQRALRAATLCFFQEARAMDKLLGLDLARDMEEAMLLYLDEVERSVDEN